MKALEQQQIASTVTAGKPESPTGGSGAPAGRSRWGDPRATMSSQGRRTAVAVLTVLAAVLLAASYFFPWWTMTLYAPQYPQGLTAVVYLHSVEGDTWEIDILNHYIGMASLQDGAVLERQLSGYAVAGISLLTFLALFAGRRAAGWFAVPVAALPLFFLGSLTYWMYRFGYNLDPSAPIAMDPFMPKILGAGLVAQFRTESMVTTGFFMAVGAAFLLILALWIRSYVCRTCSLAGNCSMVCLTGFLVEPRQQRQ